MTAALHCQATRAANSVTPPRERSHWYPVSPVTPKRLPSLPPPPIPGDTDERFSWAPVSNIALVAAALFATMAFRRFHSYHNETFDLAFYARLVWGLGFGDYHNPLVGAHLLGLHASWVLIPLGWLGRVLPIVPMMLALQAVCVAGAGVPLARIAARRIGHPSAQYLTLFVWLLHPVVVNLASYEFHPSALALLPLTVALDYLDRRMPRQAVIAMLFAVACREDVALVCALIGAVMAAAPKTRALGLKVFAGGLGYFALYLFVVAPHYLPRAGSLQLHYGHLGNSPAEVALSLLRHPLATLKSFVTPARALYLPRMLLPVAFLPLLKPRWLLPAMAPVAINLLSQFPTAVQVHSHYSAFVVPFVVLSAIHGAARVMVIGAIHAERYGLVAALAVTAGTVHMQHRAGSLPGLGRHHLQAAYTRDARANSLDAVAALLAPEQIVAGPDYLLPHIAERRELHRYQPPMRNRVDVLVLSAEHRNLHTGTQEIWRNTEEEQLRQALLQPNYGVYRVVGDYLLLRRNWEHRTYARGRYVDFEPDSALHAAHTEVGASLIIAGWGMTPIAHGTRVTVLVVPRETWPIDLGFELGWGPMREADQHPQPEQTYAFLPFDGVFLPNEVRVGEVARTSVEVPATPNELRAHGVYFGARRIDGSRLNRDSLHWTPLR